MFEQLQPAPPDPILGLTEAFRRDPNPRKVNLGAGVYRDANGGTPILSAVKAAETRLLETEGSKSYLPIDGLPGFGEVVQGLLFGQQATVVADGRAVTVQTPGGTGALRVAADLIARVRPETQVWVSDPTWPNHFNIFRAAHLAVESYPYFDPSRLEVAFEAFVDALHHMQAGDIIVLHGCCHNPTGADLLPEQWETVAQILASRGIVPLVDFAYQGFGDGLEPDATGVRVLTQHCPEVLIASSFSKNFGLYNERVGALTLVAASAQQAQVVLGHVKQVARANYSNPPAHGAKIVHTVLTDPDLRRQWEEELTAMRHRIHAMRHLLAETLHERGAPRDFSFLTRQKGMFSYTGLTPEQVDLLRERYSIYMVRSGRINVAGLTEHNVEYVAQAIVDVLREMPPEPTS